MPIIIPIVIPNIAPELLPEAYAVVITIANATIVLISTPNKVKFPIPAITKQLNIAILINSSVE